MPLRRLSLSLALSAALAAGSARAADGAQPLTKEQCVAASESAITFRSSGKLRASRAELVRCGSTECPGILREDCASSLRALDDRIPTVVFGVRDDAGHEILDARVVVEPQAQGGGGGGEGADDAGGIPLDGRARAFDPGPYLLRVMREEATIATESIVLHEGEKNRLVSITIALPHASGPATATDAAPPAEKPPTPRPRRSIAYPVVPIALAGLGAVSFGIAGGLSLHLDSRVDHLRDSCAPGCTPEQRAGLSSGLTAVNVSVVAGVALLAAAGITWFLLRPTPSTRTAWVTWIPSPAPGLLTFRPGGLVIPSVASSR